MSEKSWLQHFLGPWSNDKTVIWLLIYGWPLCQNDDEKKFLEILFDCYKKEGREPDYIDLVEFQRQKFCIPPPPPDYPPPSPVSPEQVQPGPSRELTHENSPETAFFENLRRKSHSLGFESNRYQSPHQSDTFSDDESQHNSTFDYETPKKKVFPIYILLNFI